MFGTEYGSVARLRSQVFYRTLTRFSRSGKNGLGNIVVLKVGRCFCLGAIN